MGKLDPQLQNIFAQAIDIADANKRAAFLKRVCGGDETLRDEVEALLRADQGAGNFMKATMVVVPANLIPSQETGDRIGRYKLLEQIGEGGFGVVWMAEQEEPVRRRVALKIIKLGMDTRQVLARFEAERQALAMMEHPNIAKVFDGGATDTGRPYFVMELVKGIPITAYCDANKLSTFERLALFIQVCQAVQHAHQKGIIHRDLKPSNILVTEQDGAPVPKVIDFGVAKATQARLTEKTLFTGLHQMIGTPAYMSPEQAGLGALDIDTRSDIYALGTLLYELLTGRTPFTQEEFEKASLDEIFRLIREEDPPKPSTRLSTLTHEELTTISTRRHSEPGKLNRLVRGDLDWIVMKGLEKNRQRRYETPDALAQDVARHLSNEPVLARPPSVPYLVAKFVRRHKAGLATASALLVLLAAGVVVSTWQAVRATRAERTQSSLRQQAEQAGVKESQQRQRAEQLRATAEDQARRIGHQLYASHMNLAFQAWERGDLTRVEQLLDEHRPQPGGEDLRGFEWFYLWRLCHSDQLTLRGHFANVRGVAFSPNGRLLATAGDDSTARIWDAQTGKEMFVLRGHLNGVTAVTFAPDGKTLVTGGGDQTVRLWDVATGEVSAVLRGHKDGVSALAFSPNGRWLASATGRLADGTNYGSPSAKFVDTTPLVAEVKVWEVEGRKATPTLAGHTASILSLAFSPDGKTLATGSADATVKLWNVATGTLETNLTGFNGPVIAVAFSPDGQSLAIGGGDPYRLRTELQIWDRVTRKATMTLKAHEGPVFAVAFSPDGRTLASGGLDQIVRFWDIVTGEEVRNIKAHQASIWAIAYDPSGRRIATASWDQKVKVWDAEQPQGMELFPNVGGYSGCFSSDGRYLIRGGTSLEVIEVGVTNAPLVIPDYRNSDIVIAVSPGGSILASAGTDQMVTLWEVGTWRRLAKLESHTDKVWQLAFSPDGRTLASSDAEVLRLWDAVLHVERAAFRPGTDGRGPLLFAPDGRTLIASGTRMAVFLDATTGLEVRGLNGIRRPKAISPDGRFLLGESPSGLNLIDLRTMETKWCINPHRANTGEVKFSPDGRTLATASWDGTAKLWNVASGQEMFTYKVPAVAWSTTFSPDGTWWAVGSGSARQSEVALFRRATLAEVEAADSPRILNQPASQTVAHQGCSATLAVTVAGRSPLFYQWRLGADELPGQTNATLTLTHVTEASMGDYRVVVTNTSGSATSLNASVAVMQVSEAPIIEINFEDRQAAATYTAFAWSENPAAISTNVIIGPGLGAGGSAGLVMTADGSGFTSAVSQRWAGFGVSVLAFAGRTNGVTTTNLSLYQVSATIKTTGLTGTNSHGRIQWQFLTPGGISLGRDFPATFTTNYQVYSMILGEGSVDPNCSVPWSEFVAGFDQINRVQCAVVADHWLPEYGPDADNALYIDNLKFVRLMPAPDPIPINSRSQNSIPRPQPTPPTKQ